MSGDILVEVSGLTRYYGQNQALKGISFTIRKGEVLGFLGPNGAGKTTTMQILTGNLAPSDGRVTIAGHNLLDEPRAAKSALGYLPEQPPLYRELTVDEYLDYCAALHRVPRRRQREAREQAKAKCGLAQSGRRLIANLSKGFQQRVGIAQAIIHMPPLVVLDEPTVGLDPIQIREIRHLIRELGKEHGVILSTHILPEVQQSCDRVQIINKGELVLSDTIEGLSQHMKTARLTTAFHRPPDPATLERLPGVRSVQQADARLVLVYDPQQDPTEALVRQSVERDWGLYELSPRRLSLEDVFLQLTTDEQTVAPEAAA